MTDKYIGLEQYKLSIDSIKEYVDKSIPHREDPEVIFTLSADKVLEIYNSTNKSMEFDKPSNIDLNSDFIMTYNNKDTNGKITKVPISGINYNGYGISITFYLGADINLNVNENKMVVLINNLNPNVTSDLILKQIKIKYLNNNYLKKDVGIRNSITIGTRLFGKNIGISSFSNGYLNEASGNASHAEGDTTTASGDNSHAEGMETTASGDNSHAEGNGSQASGDTSHAEGIYTIASGNNSHAEGNSSQASGDNSHAEGNSSQASGNTSHAEGDSTKASSENQHVQGKYNIEDTENKYAHIVGNGTDDSTRSNAHILDWNGNAWFAGNVSIDGTPTENNHLITKKYVDDKISNVPDAYTLLYPKEVDGANAYYDIYDLPLGDYRIAQQSGITTWNICVYVNNIRNQIFSTQNCRGFLFTKRSNAKITSIDKKTGKMIVIDVFSVTTGGEIFAFVAYDDGSIEIKNHKASILSANTNTEFTPTKDYHPATKKYVDDAKASIVVPTKTSELTNDSNFLTTIPDNYITDEKLSTKGYLTEHQSLDGYAKTEYVDSKTTLEETIFEGGASDTLNDYWTHCSLADGEGCWVIDKEVIIGENIENPYYIEINGTIYSPENSTYDATNKAWIYDHTMDNGKKLFICANYENQNKMVVPWDGMGSYDKLKIFTRTELGKKIEEQQQHSINKLATKEKPVFTGNISMGRKKGSTIGDYSVAIGYDTTASGKASYGEGNITKALGNNSHAEGNSTNASGDDSHAEGCMTSASGDNSHAEGYRTVASGSISHAEGNTTTSSGNYSHAEGTETTASGYTSHAEGHGTTAHGENSHAEGQGTTAHGVNQHVEGKFNIEDTKGKYAHIVGNGDSYTRSNAHTLDWNGNAWFAGKLTQEGTPTDDKDLITKKYVDDNIMVECIPISRIDETNKLISIDCNSMGTYKKYFIPNKYANVYSFSFIYTNSDNTETEIVRAGGVLSRDGFVICTRNTSTQLVLVIYEHDKYTYNKTNKSITKGLYGSLSIGNTTEFMPTSDYNPATKKYVDDVKASIVVPTKTSELTNDSNFLTEHQSLTKYATIEYVDSKLTTNYVSKEELTESTKPADTSTVKTTLNDILGGDYIE